MIDDFVRLVPESLLDRSVEAFLSGRRVFESSSDRYILGLKPAGDPTGSFTVSRNINRVLITIRTTGQLAETNDGVE